MTDEMKNYIHEQVSKTIRIGNFISNTRRRNGLSQEDLAQESGIPLFIIQSLEDNTFGIFMPKPEILIIIDEILGTDGGLFDA